MRASHAGRSPKWHVSCVFGFHPPDTATRSQATETVLPAAVTMSTPRTCFEPAVLRTTALEKRRAPATSDTRRAAAERACRESTTATTVTPARVRSETVLRASSLLVKTTALRPGATP